VGLGLSCASNVRAQTQAALDVLHYAADLIIDLERGRVEGVVSLEVRLPKGETQFVLKFGALRIKRVEGPAVVDYQAEAGRLRITLSAQSATLIIAYEGAPERGLFFDSQARTAHTVFFTEEWMVSNDDPADKATISLRLSVPPGLETIANGDQIGVERSVDRNRYHWEQTFESPAYTFGFAVGSFDRHLQSYGRVRIRSLATGHSSKELAEIFRYTADMMSFFEQKTGVPYSQATYTQALLGSSYQELSTWSLLRAEYGEMVLADSTETNLISHELAHQWWGNRITCNGFEHFWLNEAFATFMSAAYNEHRFGHEKYMADIGAYRRVYEDLVARGKDRALVFEEWSNPTRDDRSVVYFKGAYVLHELRERLGEEDFWEGIRSYSTRYFDDVVTTIQFQDAMEESSGVDLEAFFDEWVY
jgi:aminopeptidase N